MKGFRECAYRYELDLETLVWMRGAPLPTSDAARASEMPALRIATVVLLFDKPANAGAKGA